MNRSQILSLLLVAAIITVGTKTYLLWQEGPWEIPQIAQKETAAAVEEEKKEPLPVQLAMNTKNIVDNDLFDPERGTHKGKENEAVSLAKQKIQGMVLMGTVIIGDSRYAIFQDGSGPTLLNPGSKTGGTVLRLKLGDTVEGFKLSRIEDNKVAFTNGSTNVEIALDFFRKIDGEAVQAPRAVAQSRSPSPRRERPPLPPRPELQQKED